ncbi:MAG: Unknown protein [uncultured Sulfurovum sp.]|uniref:Uncharacterized protein n=1 Tax=uncultured Sulfurovum sp. TaxID=269237 RepID=A0A6S6TZT1_9BACT|nr:MAG: Unknown protein [uncultured Sulfurovum sp.]
MNYTFLLILTLSFSLLNATNFKDINPKPTKTMLENQLNAKDCASPITASETISEDFKYGCFCGKDYPILDNNESEDFRKLSKEKREKIIESYFLIKPYDDIDALCMQHDICYLYQGKKAKVCNRAIYDELRSVKNKFKTDQKSTKNKECKHLANDISSIFKTIFASADDEDSIFELGALFFNTSLTISQKIMEESIDTVVTQDARYPDKGEKCLLPSK